MEITLENIIDRIRIIPVKELREIFSPHYRDFQELAPEFDDAPKDISPDEIGAIISIESSKVHEGEHVEDWRLAPTATGDINRHYTEMFYTNWSGDDARRDLFARDSNPEVLLRRTAALTEALEFADKFLKSPDLITKKLVVHCIRALHRSPLLTAAIIAHQLPQASANEVFKTMFAVGKPNPQLRMGELAFIDAYLDRDGELIRTWDRIGRHNRFNPEIALELHEKFSGILGASRGQTLRPGQRHDEDFKC